jgi:hypothetical protein
MLGCLRYRTVGPASELRTLVPQAAAPPPLSTSFTEGWGTAVLLTELQDILKKILLDQGSSSQCSEMYRQNVEYRLRPHHPSISIWNS